jgi:UDP-N-acetylmuramoylalanine--D-glutamate ligase
MYSKIEQFGKTAILGYGIEGQSVTRWLLKHGVFDISIFEEKKTPEAIGEPFKILSDNKIHFNYDIFPKEILNFQTIIFSPGIRPDLPALNQARAQGITVTTATNIFMDLCPCPIIGVTGTKGKGTTSALITEIVKKSGKRAFLGGNIGTAPLDFLDDLDNESFVVLEMSSFQLFSLTKSPHIAVILMVTSEHLDYHKDEEEYVTAKQGIVKFQTLDDVTVVNSDYPNSLSVAEISACDPVKISTRIELERGCFVKDGFIYYRDELIEEQIMPLKNIFIPGKHNWENVVATVAVAKILGIGISDIQQVLMSFKGLPHRLELVADINGVRYYDDSFSTTPETAIAAIYAFSQPKILILGGSSKNSDFRDLGKVISQSKSIRGIIGIGVEWPKIKKEIKIHDSRFKIYEGCKNMNEIVDTARSIAQSGDVVLLSPACASFDMFKNYKDRGEQFKEQVKLFNKRIT